MRRSVVRFVAVIGLFASAVSAQDVSLFDQTGKAQAYMALDDEMTIYLWSGGPVAYLKADENGYGVYGFNGKHLGWFVAGVIWDHQGDASCATKDRFSSTQFEPFKSFKEFKPFKSFTEFAPFHPQFKERFGNFPCEFLLAGGAK